MIRFAILIILIYTPIRSNSESFIEAVPISWEELKTIQYSVSLELSEEFKLSPACPQNIESYDNMPKRTFMQTILWSTYVWYEYILFDGMKCIIMVENYSNERPEKLLVLSNIDTKILLSASRGDGFLEKGYYDYSNKINEYNSRVINKNRSTFKDLKNTIKQAEKFESYDNIFVKDALLQSWFRKIFIKA